MTGTDTNAAPADANAAAAVTSAAASTFVTTAKDERKRRLGRAQRARALTTLIVSIAAVTVAAGFLVVLPLHWLTPAGLTLLASLAVAEVLLWTATIYWYRTIHRSKHPLASAARVAAVAAVVVGAIPVIFIGGFFAVIAAYVVNN